MKNVKLFGTARINLMHPVTPGGADFILQPHTFTPSPCSGLSGLAWAGQQGSR